jgi:hypothetical protein
VKLQNTKTWRGTEWAKYKALLETIHWDVEILIRKEVKFRETLLNSRAVYWSVVIGL